MPLEPGESEETISRNIAKLVSEGYSTEKAVAIAYSHARRDCADECPLCGALGPPSA